MDAAARLPCRIEKIEKLTTNVKAIATVKSVTIAIRRETL
jgi:hypothetical protein